MTQETIESLARRLAESLPQGLRNVRAEVEQNFRTVLTAGLAKLDLVSREEFDVQQAVLARTRAKLDALEKRLDELERPQRPATTENAAARKAAGKSTRKKTARRKASGKANRPDG